MERDDGERERERRGGRLTFSGGSDFLGEPSNDATGSVVLVESVGQLWEEREGVPTPGETLTQSHTLSGSLQLLSESEAVQHAGILYDGRKSLVTRRPPDCHVTRTHPLVLEQLEDCWNTGSRRWAWLHKRVGWGVKGQTLITPHLKINLKNPNIPLMVMS